MKLHIIHAATALENYLQVIDITDPASPSLAGQCAVARSPDAVAFAGDYAYLACRDSGLRIIDVSNPANPTEVGHYDTPNYCAGVTIAGNLAYVGDGYSGLHILDVSNPQNPQERGYYDTPGYARGNAVAGQYVYQADDASGLQIIEFYGAGVEEAPRTPTAVSCSGSTIVRGVLRMDDWRPETGHRAELVDASGRKVVFQR